MRCFHSIENLHTMDSFAAYKIICMSWIKDYLTFSKKERIAFIILAVVMIGFIALPNLFPSKKISVSAKQDLQEAISKQPKSPKTFGEEDDNFTDEQIVKTHSLFYFDPNYLDEAGWLKLGLPRRTASTIIKYRNKGGKFRNAEDLRKIYSLRKEEADRLIPFIRMEKISTGINAGYGRDQSIKTKAHIIDINTATAEDWKSLPGIGEVLSNRIVKFRERLGGFSSIDQVSQTFGLKDSTFQLIKSYLMLASPAENKININSAYEKDLMQCKEMTIDIAKAIVIYRKQNGNYSSVEDIRKIIFISSEAYHKIAPCLTAR